MDIDVLNLVVDDIVLIVIDDILKKLFANIYKQINIHNVLDNLNRIKLLVTQVFVAF
jgi:uncharacterized protein YqhQ